MFLSSPDVFFGDTTATCRMETITPASFCTVAALNFLNELLEMTAIFDLFLFGLFLTGAQKCFNPCAVLTIRCLDDDDGEVPLGKIIHFKLKKDS